jgi:hypothetical protein
MSRDSTSRNGDPDSHLPAAASSAVQLPVIAGEATIAITVAFAYGLNPRRSPGAARARGGSADAVA